MRIAEIFIPVLFATLLLSAADSLAKDEVYRWVDENGVVHFGDRADGQAGAEQVDIQVSRDNSSSPYPTTESADPVQQAEPQPEPEPEPSYAQQRRDERAAKRQEAREKQEAIAARCEQSRQRVAKLEPTPRVLVRHEDGTVDRLDDNRRLEILAEAKNYIAEYCEK